jgi:transcriptional regulator with XRE-family HTH domain
MGIGEQVKAARKGRGWSQEELAERLDVSRPYISKVESGASVSLDVLRKLTAVLGLDPVALLGVEPSSS